MPFPTLRDPNEFGKENSYLTSLMGYNNPQQSETPTSLFGLGDAGITGTNNTSYLAATPFDASTSGNTGWSWMDSIDPKTGIKTQGMLGSLAGLGSAAANWYMGMKQYGLAKDTLKENKKQFAMNYGAQRDITNEKLRYQHEALLAANPRAYANRKLTQIA